MAIIQASPVVPPLDSDKKLIDFSASIQKSMVSLFQAGHSHLGVNGVISALPTANDGAVGDILIGIVSGTAYIFFKITSKDWYKIAAVHV